MKNKLFVMFVFIVLLIPVTNVTAKSGCCSWHGGVAGCSSNGRQVCGDGTLSKTCTCTPTYIYGCTDVSANNYNSNANKDDGSCKYDIKGCTDSTANNYNSSANVDDGSCSYDIYGCTDSTATNYNPAANKDDGSCIIESEVKMKKSSKEDTEKLDSDIKEKNIDENENSTAVPFYLYTILFVVICILKNKNDNLIINKFIKNKNYIVLQYILYYILIVPIFVDTIKLIINYINKARV